MKQHLLILTLCIACCLLTACGGAKQENESREMPISTLKLKGTHAACFQVQQPYLLRLVKTEKDGWQVRAKFQFVKAKGIDTKRFKWEVDCCPEMAYMDDSDVELQEGQLSSDYFNSLCAKELGETEELILTPFNFHPLSYDEAKKIYDGTTYIVITDLDLKELDERDEFKEAVESAGKLLNVEQQLFESLF